MSEGASRGRRQGEEETRQSKTKGSSRKARVRREEEARERMRKALHSIGMS
jgi:hypothetical protein